MSTTIRAKFIEHMEFLGLAKQTQRSYINGVKGLAKYHNQSPEKLTDEQVRAYFRHLLLERKLARTSCGSYLCGITNFTDISVIVKAMTVLDYHHSLEAENCHMCSAWKR